MRRILTTILLTLVGAALHCQPTRELDSLHQVIAQSADTQKFWAMSRLGQFYIDSASDVEYEQLSGILQFAETIDYPKGVISANFELGAHFQRHGEYERAIEYFAIAWKYSRDREDQEGVARCLMGIGRCYMDQSAFRRAHQCYLRALHIWKSVGDRQMEARAYGVLGNVNHQMENFERARMYYNKECDLLAQLEAHQFRYFCVGSIAIVDLAMGQHASAIKGFREELSILRKLGDSREIARARMNLAVAYSHAGEHQRAAMELDSSIQYFQDHEYLLPLVKAKTVRASVASELGDFNYAQELLDSCLALTYQMRSPGVREEIFHNLADLNSNKKNFERALYYYKLRVALRDSILNKENEQTLAELEHSFESERIRFENEQLKAKAQLQETELRGRNFVLTVIIFGGLLLLMVAIFLYSRKVAIEKQRAANFARDSAALEQQLLRSQMNPHFIFNAMNSIQSFIMHSDKKIANTYLSKFANLMRMVLENSQEALINLDDELMALNLYIELEALRFEKKFTYEVNVDKEIDPEEVKVPPLIVQPYVENAIHHGLLPKNAAGSLRIDVSAKEDTLVISVEDDGIGRERSRELNKRSGKEHQSVGMSITKSRLDFLNINRGNLISVKVSDVYDSNGTPEGTRVTINIPLSA